MDSVNNLYTRTISKAHLLNVAKAWLCKYDNTFYAQHNVPAMDSRLTSFFDVIFCILETYKFPTSMIIPVLIYADKFAIKQGIKHDQLFYLMLSSAMVCIKFWDDNTALRNSAIAQSFNYSVKSVNSIERNFLKGVDYDLSLSTMEICQFIERIAALPAKTFVPFTLPASSTSAPQQATPAMVSAATSA